MHTTHTALAHDDSAWVGCPLLALAAAVARLSLAVRHSLEREQGRGAFYRSQTASTAPTISAAGRA